jgi:hypothetical protein
LAPLQAPSATAAVVTMRTVLKRLKLAMGHSRM